jgi:TrpR-related protein YerC/YecD
MSLQKQTLLHRKQLVEAFGLVENLAEMEHFLIDLCTPSELRALSERWHVARLLDGSDLSYREIAAKTGVSTTTIGRVARFLNEEPHQGYRAILDRQKEA